MAANQPPMRTGLLDFFRNSSGCQFVIPVYQRNYTWTAGKEVKQYLEDLESVLAGEFENHFLGIMIYLDTPIDYSAREFSVIDGQQRLTTTFLALYAVRSLFMQQGENDQVINIEGQYLTNPYSSAKIKYKLKPMVSDDEVYQCIVEDKVDEIENKESNVYKNFIYIRNYFKELIVAGHTLNEILMAMNKLYVVCVPIGEDDNAQKIFESINATGVKLTASDLIRNFILMELESDIQDQYYINYWKKIEEYTLSVAGCNASMGRIVASPTAGSCGILPGCLVSLYKEGRAEKRDIVMSMFTSGAFGMVIAKNASIAGATGGCQAECGSASGMAAAALVELMGGSPDMCADALAIAIANQLGLACDPVAGLVEIPCIKRNVSGIMIAFSSADMVLAGIRAYIPADECIGAMQSVGDMMNSALKETAAGGLAATPTGRKLKEKVFGAEE